jgi:hypothetical protein
MGLPPWSRSEMILHPMLNQFSAAQFLIGDFLLPWEMVIAATGFLAAWLVMVFIEQFGWTRHLWNLPLLFIALVILLGSALGLCLAP